MNVIKEMLLGIRLLNIEDQLLLEQVVPTKYDS